MEEKEKSLFLVLLMALFSTFWMEDIDFNFAQGPIDYVAKLGTHKSS